MVVYSDAELVRMAQGGDAASLGVLLELHRAPLYAFALGFLGHGPDAQDAVQDAFLLALRKIGQLKEPEAAGAWLRAIVRNVCLSRLRERRDVTTFAELVEGRGLKEPSSAEKYMDRLAMRDWVWTALSELPEALRVAAMLRYFGSYSPTRRSRPSWVYRLERSRAASTRSRRSWPTPYWRRPG